MMVLTFFPVTNSHKDYAYNFYRVYSFGKDKNLITTDHGAWVLLDDEEYKLLRSHQVHRDPELFTVLEDKGIIVTRDNFKRVVEDFRKRFHFLFRGPTLHIVVPTFRCNMKCIYCHSTSKLMSARGFDMDEDTAKSIVDFIFTSPSKSFVIEFQGGEPLARFDIVRFIVDYALKKSKETKKEVKFSLVTNLTMMDEDKLNFLKSRRIMGISVSFDGPKEVHDKNRKYVSGAGTYDDVTYWIRRINTEFKYDFNLNALTTITRFSLPFYKEIVNEFIKFNLKMIWFRFLNNLGYARSAWKRIGYAAEEYLEFYKRGLDYVIEVNKRDFILEVFTTIIARKILQIPDPMFVDIMSPCGAGGIGQLLYDHKGDIYTCDEAKILDTFKLGNVKNVTLKDVLTHPTTVSMANVSTKLSLICDSCPWSPYCGVCPVHLYVTQGSIVPKLVGEFRCRIFSEMIRTVFLKIFNKDERKIIIKWVNSLRL